MKKKNKRNNGMDYDEYIKMQNNKSKSKMPKKQDKHDNVPKITSLESLCSMFPNISPGIIEDIYEENNKNFSHTKETLKIMSESENNENIINNEIKMEIEENEQKPKKKKFKKKRDKNIKDISEKAGFNVVGNDESIDNNIDKDGNEEYSDEQKEEQHNNIIKNDNINNDNFKNDYNKLLYVKDKNYKEYSSIFEYNNFNNNDNNIINNNMNNKFKEEPMIDDYLFDKNINFLRDCFKMKKEDIIVKLCEFKFDINKVVSNIMNEKYQIDAKEENDSNMHLNDNDIEKILLNFENGDNNEYYEEDIMVQKAIESSFKNNNNNEININNNNINNDIMMEEDLNDEDFLDKKIEDIKNPKIKEDLNQLISDFPSEEEYYIKSTYYSCDKDYDKTFKYLDSKDVTKNLGLKTLMNSKLKKPNQNYNSISTIKPKKNFNKPKSEAQNHRYSTLKKILENKPINWKFEEDKNININDYIAIRNRLYQEAKNFFAVKNYKTGQLLMNKAKRYSQEIEKIAQNRGLNKFMENNRYNSNNKEIDLHGLRVDESKAIINSKIEILRQKKIEDNLKSIDLTIITGTGSHSEGGKPVLYPELLSWLKAKNKIKVNGRLEEGAIYITIF